MVYLIKIPYDERRKGNGKTRRQSQRQINGVEGMVMGRTEYLNGCVSIGLLSLELKDGKPQDWVWMDEQRVDITSKAEKGGPQPEAPMLG